MPLARMRDLMGAQRSKLSRARGSAPGASWVVVMIGDDSVVGSGTATAMSSEALLCVGDESSFLDLFFFCSSEGWKKGGCECCIWWRHTVF